VRVAVGILHEQLAHVAALVHASAHGPWLASHHRAQREVRIVEGEHRFEQVLGQPVAAALRRTLLVVIRKHVGADGAPTEEQFRRDADQQMAGELRIVG
jgi:septum formation topological specificity factor MinE